MWDASTEITLQLYAKVYNLQPNTIIQQDTWHQSNQLVSVLREKRERRQCEEETEGKGQETLGAGDSVVAGTW